MTEPGNTRQHVTPSTSPTNTSGIPGPVTAARRHGNLETIRKQPGWKNFPDCIPLPMRTTKSGKVTEFGNTKLRIIERIAIHTNFNDALTWLRAVTEDGSRLLSLKDLEQCAAHFDTSKKSQSRDRGSSSAPPSTVVSHADDEEPSYHSMTQPLDTWNNFSLDQDTMSGHTGHPLQPLKRPSPESFASMSVSPVEPKRPRMDTFFDPHSTDFMFNVSEQDLNSTTNLGFSTYQQHNDPSLRVPTPNLPPQSPSQNPARALLSIHSHAGSIFSNLNTAFDDLLARVDDQQQLVKAALDQLRMATSGLGVVSSGANGANEKELETGLRTAQRAEVRARQDLQQARSARDVIDIQYGHIGTSLSRALVETVRAEFTRAEATMTRAQADVESARHRLNNANNREQALRRTKEVAEVGIDQLQRQTRFWLKRLAEAGVKLTDQLGTLQGRDTGQTSSQR
ncbi:hypothetical protein AUEXF2481DRAFT_32564 [Aureobasidium subglaciale EXF-2481]|uniref:Uncharacterized protein n=1 Tax=Aureobasidium subglaciale (strain EXF-2481) TaxID=1043005 RepID=A0A074Y800_AURSE|nr:uncharacterized protein AUEXF2481DRAFT_32564 [Aureobasidium subglaciale EXF-2481]KAI5207268.1 hypothetical protein E4T38_03371 [Aureobasidium subglaciale]KAI5226235.1 hypothetical protein E4T40_03252 [Aureobasidium subglaciale]KAI5229482.1 hypothetical protein E4T41_03368 [Aureobasidium subglaciale]KAI5264258.1 hypothetical protein E4T46_03146 [Aureobasidium subglaciale]KEQ92084.1 hypothetical protein AUEXF2481DRAFT_32564 [Aureobasidium subglaciale EXF-2481]